MSYKNQIKDIKIAKLFKKNGDNLILFIHGLGCAKECFIGAWKIEEFNNFSLLATDLVGHGQSSSPATFSYTIKDQAERIMIELDNQPWKKVSIVAHSMGGAIGLFLAEILGNRLDAFINVEGSLNVAGPASRIAASVPYEEFSKTTFDNLRHNLALSANPGWEHWAKWMQHADPLGFYRSSRDLIELIRNDELVIRFNQLKTKKIYLYGDQSFKNLDRVLSAIPDIQKVNIPDSGHFPMIENPNFFYSIIKQNLSI